MPVSIDQIVVQLTAHMSDEQKLGYIIRFTKERRNPNTALLLGLFLGAVGAQHYYMGRVGKGVLCTLFSWTLVPLVLSLFACRRIRADVQRHNFARAVELAEVYCPGLQVDFAAGGITLDEPLFPIMRSVLAVVLGYVVMLVAQLGGDMALTAVAPAIMPQPGEAPEPAYFGFRLGTGFVFISIGGYASALLAGRSEMKQALSVGALSIAAGILEAFYFSGEQPLWYSIGLMFLSIPAALVGGYVRLRQLASPKTQVVEVD